MKLKLTSFIAVCIALGALTAGPVIADEPFQRSVDPPPPVVRHVLAGDGPIDVRVPVADGGRRISTVVEFPEQIAEIVSGWHDDLSFERSRDKLFLAFLGPKESVRHGHLDVIGTSGRLYRLVIEPGGEGEIVSVRLLEHRARKVARIARSLTPIDLMKAMRLNEIPIGVSMKRVEKEDESNPVLADFRLPGFHVSIETVFRSPVFVGYILKVTNTRRWTVDLDITRVRVSRLLCIGSDRYRVAGHGTARLYVVRER